MCMMMMMMMMIMMMIIALTEVLNFAICVTNLPNVPLENVGGFRPHVPRNEVSGSTTVIISYNSNRQMIPRGFF